MTNFALFIASNVLNGAILISIYACIACYFNNIIIYATNIDNNNKCSLRSGDLLWKYKNRLQQEDLKINWHYENMCRDAADCQHLISNPVSNTSKSSEMKLIMQPQQKLRLDIDSSDENNTILILENAEIAYKSCKSSKMHTVLIKQARLTFEFVPLSYGNYYIIDNDPERCRRGYRLQITVPMQDCSSEHLPDGILCSNNGICKLLHNQSTFRCCCPNNNNDDRYCAAVIQGENQTVESQELEKYVKQPTKHKKQNTGSLITEEECRNMHQRYGNCSRTNVCLNGVCIEDAVRFQCYCQPGFFGDCCEKKINPCISNPCLHGVCKPDGAQYKCYCRTGWTGFNCEKAQNLGPCYPNPCKPSEQCIVTETSYDCFSASLDYLSTISRCKINKCENNGQCLVLNDRERCLCTGLFTGRFCTVRTSRYDDHQRMRSIWAGLGILALAFFIIATVLVVCHCHNYTCKFNKTGHYESFDRVTSNTYYKIHRNSMNNLRYTSDDLSMTSTNSTLLSHQAQHPHPEALARFAAAHDTNRLATEKL